MKIRTKKHNFSLLGAGLACILALSATTKAQSTKPIVYFAPSNAILTLEINNWSAASSYLNNFSKEFQRLKLDQMILSALDMKIGPAEMTIANDLVGLLGKEAFLSLSLATIKNEIQPVILLAAKSTDTSSKKFQTIIDKEFQKAKSSGQKINSIDESGFKILSNSEVSIGFSRGMTYLSNDLTALRSFLKGIAGKSGNYLGNSASYSKVMSKIGSSTMQAYLNLSSIGGTVLQLGLKEADLGSQFNAKALQNALATLGQLAGGFSINAQGINSTGMLSPNVNGGDKGLYNLLMPKISVNKASFMADKVAPATVLSFSTQTWNASQIYSYLIDFIERLASMKKGDLSSALKLDMQLDLQKDLFSWMSNEISMVTFAPIKGTNNPLSIGGEFAVYIKVNNLSTAQAGLKKSMMQISMLTQSLLGNLMTGQNPGKSTKSSPAKPVQPKTTTINGTQVTRYVLSEGLSISTAFKNGFLIVSSDNGMLAALASGPRLSDSNTFKSTVARVPNNITGYGFGDTGSTLRNLSGSLDTILSLGLSQAADMKPSDSQKLANGITQFLNFVAQRAGNSVSWTEVTPQGPLMRSFTPVKW